jgi:hypothetical protein
VILEHVRQCLAAGPCWFYILVPATAIHEQVVMTDTEAWALARRRLAGALARFRAEGASVTGGVGDPNPMRAVADAISRMAFDEIILSTLPVGSSRWISEGLPARLARASGMHITHLVADGRVGVQQEAVGL